VSTCFQLFESIDVCLNCVFDAFYFICVFCFTGLISDLTNEKKLKMCDISFVQMENADKIHLKRIGDIGKVYHIAEVHNQTLDVVDL